MFCSFFEVHFYADDQLAFDEDYELIPIETVSQFVAENKHLPGKMPANKMMDEGVNIAEMQVKLLQKIEELTLYIIIQQKEIERLNTLFIGNE